MVWRSSTLIQTDDCNMFECVESQIDDMMKEMPDSLKIPSSHLTLATTSIGQGTILILNPEDIQYVQLLASGMSLNVLKCVLYFSKFQEGM